MTNQEIINRGELIRDETVTGANTAQRVGEAFVAIGENLEEVTKRNEPIVFTESKEMNAFIKTLYVDVSGYNGEGEILDLWAYFFVNTQNGTKYISLYNAQTNGIAIVKFFTISSGSGKYCRRFSNGIYLYIEVNESIFPIATIPGRFKLTKWSLSNTCDPRPTDAGYTENVLANKFIRALYIDTTEYTGDVEALKSNLRFLGLYNSLTTSKRYYFGLKNISSNSGYSIYHDDTAPTSVVSKKITFTSTGSITVNAIIDWKSLGDNTTIFSSCEERIYEKAFNPDFWYAQIEREDIDTIKTQFNSKVYTSNPSANQVIRKLYLDVSGYTGSYSLEGLSVRNLAKNVATRPTYGLQLRNSSGDIIVSFWIYPDNYEDESDTEGLKRYLSIIDKSFNGIYCYAEFNWDNMEDGNIYNIQLTSEATNPINDPRKKIGAGNLTDALLEIIRNGGGGGSTPLKDGLYGCIGDSITQGAGGVPDLPAGDVYAPLTGTKKPTYGYHIAKTNGISWHNYGISGSTLGDVTVNGVSHNGFAKENGRYTQLASGLTHISIFFGWNDDYFGHRMKREDWLKATYGSTIYYPEFTNQIGTTHANGTPYATQEQYDACNSQTGTVNGVSYNNSSDYWKAVYIGTPNDNIPYTFWGAWNIVLNHIIANYPSAKILLIVPYGTGPLMRQTVRDAARRYGLCYFDFGKADAQMFAYGWYDEDFSYSTINGSTLRNFRKNLLLDGTHPTAEGYKYMFPSINAKLCSI